MFPKYFETSHDSGQNCMFPTLHDTDIGLDLKVSWCKALPARLLHQSLYKTTRTHHVWEHLLGVMASID